METDDFEYLETDSGIWVKWSDSQPERSIAFNPETKLWNRDLNLMYSLDINGASLKTREDWERITGEKSSGEAQQNMETTKDSSKKSMLLADVLERIRLEDWFQEKPPTTSENSGTSETPTTEASPTMKLEVKFTGKRKEEKKPIEALAGYKPKKEIKPVEEKPMTIEEFVAKGQKEGKKPIEIAREWDKYSEEAEKKQEQSLTKNKVKEKHILRQRILSAFLITCSSLLVLLKFVGVIKFCEWKYGEYGWNWYVVSGSSNCLHATPSTFFSFCAIMFFIGLFLLKKITLPKINRVVLFINKHRTKTILIALSVLVCFHICFISSKKFSVYAKISPEKHEGIEYLDNSDRIYEINNASEEQYQNFINTIPSYDKRIVITKTSVKYLFILPEWFSYFFYLGYLVIVIGFILSLKFNLNELKNEN